MAVSLAACMVTYESAHVLQRSLGALRRAAEGRGLEVSVTVVDNASTDGSADAAVAAWPGARVIRNETNRGYAPAMNQAIAAAATDTGTDWLLLLNPDALVGEDALRLLPDVDRLPEIGVFTPLLTDEAGVSVPTAYRWPMLGKELARLAGAGAAAARLRQTPPGLPGGRRIVLAEPVGEAIAVDYPVGACLFVRTATWGRVGPFDEAFVLYHEEMEWCWRAAAMGIRAFVLPRAHAVHIGEASSRSRPAESLLWRYRGLLRFYEKHRSIGARAALRAAIAGSFGARAAVAGLARRPERRVLADVSRLGLHGSGTNESGS